MQTYGILRRQIGKRVNFKKKKKRGRKKSLLCGRQGYVEGSGAKPHKVLDDEMTRESQIHSNISNLLESRDKTLEIFNLYESQI